jgi:tetratricopeptide (TPR) repeat protein
VEQSAAAIAEKLPAGTRVVSVGFEAEHENLAAYIMDELAGALVGSNIEVADRNNLDFVQKELNFQAAGVVDDENMARIGKFLGADFIITGQLVNIGSAYRCRVNAINVESAKHEISERLTVRSDRAVKNLVAALRDHKPAARKASYGGSGSALPSSAGAFLDRGIIFAMRGDYDMAIEDFTEAIKLKPDLVSAYMLRGRALFASVSKVTGVGENFSDVRTLVFSRATAEQKTVYDRAIADYSSAIKIDPNDAKAYRSRGIAYNSKGDFDRAIADFNQAIKIDPNYASAYNSRGIAYDDKGDYDRAIADYSSAIKIDPNYASAYYNRGLAYMMSKGDFDRAVADCTSAIKINPNYADAYNARGFAYRKKGDYDRAIADCTSAIKIDPNNQGYKNNLETAKRRGR